MKSVLLAIAAVLFSTSMVFAQTLPMPTHTSEVGCSISTEAVGMVDANLKEYKYVVNNGRSNPVYFAAAAIVHPKATDNKFEASCYVLFGTEPGQFTLGIRSVGFDGQESATQYISVDIVAALVAVPYAVSEICLNVIENGAVAAASCTVPIN